MVAFSKFSIEQSLGAFTCSELLHPPVKSCTKSALKNIPIFLSSNAKYYWPMAALQVLMKVKSFDGKVLWQIFVYYMQLTLGGFVNGYVTSVGMCCLRQLLGEFHMSTILFVPALIGSSLSVFLSPRAKHIQHTGIFEAAIESLLIQRRSFITRAIFDSKLLQTLIFMLCSAVILDAKQQCGHKDFWFLQADKLNTKVSTSSSRSCSHAELICSHYIGQGIRNYFTVGFMLDVFKMIISSPKAIALRKLQLNSTILLTSYIGIYRTTHCFLNQCSSSRDRKKNHLLAAFIGGAVYGFYPKVTILSYGLLQAWQIVWKYHLKVPNPKGFISYGDVLYPLGLAYLIHTYVFHPRNVSNLAAIFIDKSTANYAVTITKRLKQQVAGFEAYALSS